MAEVANTSQSANTAGAIGTAADMLRRADSAFGRKDFSNAVLLYDNAAKWYRHAAFQAEEVQVCRWLNGHFCWPPPNQVAYHVVPGST